MKGRKGYILHRFRYILANEYGKQIDGQDITVGRAVEVLTRVLDELEEDK